MKNVVMAVLLLVGVSGFAQEAKTERKRAERPELTAEQRLDLRVKELTLKLDLNASQQKEMKQILADAQAKSAKSREEMKANREKGTKPTADQVYARRSKMLEEQIALKEKVKKVLTKEQMEKWEQLHQDRPQKFQNRMHKRGEKAPEAQPQNQK